MLRVVNVNFVFDTAVVGYEIKPYVLLNRPDGIISYDDVPEAAPVGGHFMQYKWYRIQRGRTDPVCSVHPTEEAQIQCIGCTKSNKIPVAKSYHCSSKCFVDSWRHHSVLHERAKKNITEEELRDLIGSGSSGVERSSGETWFDVGRARTYTPTAVDIGHVLRFECRVVHKETAATVGAPTSVTTSSVIPAPTPTPRRLIPVNATDITGHIDLNSGKSSLGTFTVLSYTILADTYVTSYNHGYCPKWALSWTYRRHNLLREIIGYRADIICLQEVQNNHFKDFFEPELGKQGYHAVFKERTTQVYKANPLEIDGCATFFRKDLFSYVKKYEVEFNQSIHHLADAIPVYDKNMVLTRFRKDNVTLIVLLEAKFGNQEGERDLLCVSNTHLQKDLCVKDVNILQVQVLLNGLQKIAGAAGIPILVCGDFNATPGSTSHRLLAMSQLNPLHSDLVTDPFGILRRHNVLKHQLPLVSAYSSFARTVGVGYDLEQQRRRMNLTTNEPLFTKYTGNFCDTVNYILYTADSLTVDSLLELLDKDSLTKNTALPSPEWSSDHIALLAAFRYKPRNRR